MPCGTAVLQREQHIWVYLQALLLNLSSSKNSSSSSSSSSSRRVVSPHATKDALALRCMDGTVIASLCEGLWAPQAQQQQQCQLDNNQQQQQQQQQQGEGPRQEAGLMEERLLQAVCECPFSKRCGYQHTDNQKLICLLLSPFVSFYRLLFFHCLFFCLLCFYKAAALTAVSHQALWLSLYIYIYIYIFGGLDLEG